MEILEALKSKKPDDVAKDFNIGYSTVKKIRQNEEEIRKIALSNGNYKKKISRRSSIMIRKPNVLEISRMPKFAIQWN